MDIHIHPQAAPTSEGSCTVVFTKDTGRVQFHPKQINPRITIGLAKVTDKISFQLRVQEAVRLALAEHVRKITFNVRELLHVVAGCESISLNDSDLARLLMTSIHLANYNPDSYKTVFGPEGRPGLQTVHFAQSEEFRFDLEKADIVGCNQTIARMLADTPPNYQSPSKFMKQVFDLCEGTGIDCSEVTRESFGLLNAVGQGAPQSEYPRLLILKYRGDSPSSKPVVFIGKSIVHDSGGLNMKSTDGIMGMHRDMSGGALAVGIILTLAEMKADCNLTVILAVADNAVSSTAIKPDSIMTSYAGLTVEMANTDAEGRLVVADAISYAIRDLDPLVLIDAATLTGACHVALGGFFSGFMTPSDRLAEFAYKSAEFVGEPIWRLPLLDRFEHLLKSKVADIKNSGGRNGGASIGGGFVHRFIRDTDPNFDFSPYWMHWDIASTMETVPGDHLAEGCASGEPMRTFVDMIPNLYRCLSVE